MNWRLKEAQDRIDDVKRSDPDANVGMISDTYHTFNELYRERTILCAALLMYLPYAWKAKVHEDGSSFKGMFIVGAPTPDGMMSYHVDNEYWNLYKVPELPHAPHFDGYTAEDVCQRLSNFVMSSNRRMISENNFNDIYEIVENEILPVFGNDLVAKASFIGFYKSL